jgi:hypothetical protein
MDPDALKAVSKAGTEILAPPAVIQTVTSAKPISNGETKTWQDWTIEAIPAYNLKRGPSEGKLFHDKGRGNGYILSYGGKRIYISGDTEGIPEMKALKNISVAFLAMNPPRTMSTLEAAGCAKAFHPQIVYPYHYDQVLVAKLGNPNATAEGPAGGLTIAQSLQAFKDAPNFHHDSFALKDAHFLTSVAAETNDASSGLKNAFGWYVGPAYTFSWLPWKPTLSTRSGPGPTLPGRS